MTQTDGMAEKIAEFRSDPQKMEITTKFVNDVIAEAKIEAMNRAKQSEKVSSFVSVNVISCCVNGISSIHMTLILSICQPTDPKETRGPFRWSVPVAI